MKMKERRVPGVMALAILYSSFIILYLFEVQIVVVYQRFYVMRPNLF